MATKPCLSCLLVLVLLCAACVLGIPTVLRVPPTTLSTPPPPSTCHTIMTSFGQFEARVAEAGDDVYSQYLMTRLLDNLGLSTTSQYTQHTLRQYLCQYVGVSSLSQLAAVHGLTPRQMRHYYQFLRDYWYFMRSELEESLQVNRTTISVAGRRSLLAYLSLLHAIEGTGFLDISK